MAIEEEKKEGDLREKLAVYREQCTRTTYLWGYARQGVDNLKSDIISSLDGTIDIESLGQALTMLQNFVGSSGLDDAKDYLRQLEEKSKEEQLPENVLTEAKQRVAEQELSLEYLKIFPEQALKIVEEMSEQIQNNQDVSDEQKAQLAKDQENIEKMTTEHLIAARASVFLKVFSVQINKSLSKEKEKYDLLKGPSKAGEGNPNAIKEAENELKIRSEQYSKARMDTRAAMEILVKAKALDGSVEKVLGRLTKDLEAKKSATDMALSAGSFFETTKEALDQLKKLQDQSQETAAIPAITYSITEALTAARKTFFEAETIKVVSENKVKELTEALDASLKKASKNQAIGNPEDVASPLDEAFRELVNNRDSLAKMVSSEDASLIIKKNIASIQEHMSALSSSDATSIDKVNDIKALVDQIVTVAEVDAKIKMTYQKMHACIKEASQKTHDILIGETLVKDYVDKFIAGISSEKFQENPMFSKELEGQAKKLKEFDDTDERIPQALELYEALKDTIKNTQASKGGDTSDIPKEVAAIYKSLQKLLVRSVLPPTNGVVSKDMMDVLTKNRASLVAISESNKKEKIPQAVIDAEEKLLQRNAMMLASVAPQEEKIRMSTDIKGMAPPDNYVAAVSDAMCRQLLENTKLIEAQSKASAKSYDGSIASGAQAIADEEVSIDAEDEYIKFLHATHPKKPSAKETQSGPVDMNEFKNPAATLGSSTASVEFSRPTATASYLHGLMEGSVEKRDGSERQSDRDQHRRGRNIPTDTKKNPHKRR